MDCRSLSPQQLPHTPKLIRDYVEDFPKLQSFFTHSPDLHSAESYARQLKFPAERRQQIAAILRKQNVSFGSGEQTESNLVRLEKGAVAVVSGQQVGLFGGPSYSFYKAITAIEVAQELTKSGIDAVPIFWMATEDHDLEEIRHTTWFHEGNLHRFELPKFPEDDCPVGNVVLGESITDLVNQAANLISGPDSSMVAEILRASYTPQDTYGSAFAKMFSRIFAEQGLILLDPLAPAIHRLATPLLRDALVRRDELNEALLNRGKELDKAGYPPQVKVTSKSTLLFSLQGGKRQVISATNGNFLTGADTAPRAEILANLESAAENFGPNALLRPVMQDFLLPTVIYLGGPSEISYFAQSQVLYQKLLGYMPVVLPRADFTLVDPKAVRILTKYGLQVEDVWLGAQSLLTRMYSQTIPGDLAKTFDTNLKLLASNIAELQQAVSKVDPTMEGVISRGQKRIKYQLEKLRQKTGVSLDRHEKLIESHARFLENLLYPQKNLQSRDLCFLPFLARLGTPGLRDLQKCASLKKPGRHVIVPIP
jgi:bacillithiol synthase